MTLGPAYPSGGGGVDGTPIAPTTVDSTDTTQSTSTTTGAIKTAGGVGIAKDVYVGGIVAMSVGAVGTPSYTFTGDLDTGMWHSAANTLDFSAGGVRGLQIVTAASGQNYFKLTPSSGDNRVVFDVAGAGTNVGAELKTLGTGVFQFLSHGGANLQFHILGTASATSNIRVRSGTAATGVSNVEVDGTNGATNADLGLVPLGTGLVRFGTAAASVATASTHQIGMKAADGTTYYLLATTVA